MKGKSKQVNSGEDSPFEWTQEKMYVVWKNNIFAEMCAKQSLRQKKKYEALKEGMWKWKT